MNQSFNNRFESAANADVVAVELADTLLERAQAVVEKLSRLLESRSANLSRPVNDELLSDLLAVMPGRSNRAGIEFRGQCSL